LRIEPRSSSQRKLGSLAALALLAACAQHPAVEPARPVTYRPLPPQPVADFVLVDKSERTLRVYADGVEMRRYTGIQLGDAPQGHKHFQGDEKTPEGRYVIDYRNPNSAYHLSLHISYPNEDDVRYAWEFNRSAGGEIFIHGQPNGMARRPPGDWTDGCIALSNAEIEELWRLVPDGTGIEIRP
jgi:murein L,D-transpeptidase YafK